MSVLMFIFPIFYIGFFVFIIVMCSKNSLSKKMTIKDEVSEKYNNRAYELIKNNDEVDKARRANKVKRLISGLLIIGLFVLTIFVMANNMPFLGFLTFGGIFLVLFLSTRNKDNLLFDKIVYGIMKEYNETFSYNHKNGIDKMIYREAGFEGFDRYRSDDLIKGEVKGCPFELGEVHTERRHTDSEGRTHYTTIFHGTFIKVNLNKDFDCIIKIVNNKIKLFNKDQYITIDNEAFEKIYDVFTDDKIKAMRLLTPDVTTNMIDIYNNTGLYCELKIIGTFLYIRLYTGQLFPFSFSNPEKEAKNIGRSVAVIDTVFTVVNNILDEVERFDV